MPARSTRSRKTAQLMPMRLVHRGSGLEQMTPALRALLTEAANREPYSLSLSLWLLVKRLRGIKTTDEEIAAYFTPAQQRTLAHQCKRVKQWSRAWNKRHGYRENTPRRGMQRGQRR